MILAFGFNSAYSHTIPFTFRPDMTWADFINSEFNPNITDVYPELETTGKMFRAVGNSIKTFVYDGESEWFETGICIYAISGDEPIPVAVTDKIKVTLYSTED